MSLRKNDSEDNHDLSTDREHQQQLDFSGRRQLLRQWLTDDTHVKHFLRVLFDHTPDNRSDSFLLLDTIVKEMSSSRRTVQRAIKQAQDEGLLIVFGPKSRRRCNTYRLRIAEIYDRAKAEMIGANLAPEGRQIVTPDAPNRRLRGANMAHRNCIETVSKPPPKRGAHRTPCRRMGGGGGRID